MADRFLSVLQNTAAIRQQEVRDEAVEMGWPESLASSLTLAVDDTTGEFGFTWPKNRQQEVLDQEGGTLTEAPKPAMHKFAHDPRNTARTKQVLYEQMIPLLLHAEQRMFL